MVPVFVDRIFFTPDAALHDFFDALTHARPYKPAWTVSDAVEEIKRGGGAQFDPELVDAFSELDHDALV